MLSLPFTPNSNSITLEISMQSSFATAPTNGLFRVDSAKVEKTEYDPVTTLALVDNKGGDRYEFGFNGRMKDNEIAGMGNSLDFGARIYNSRLARFLSIDPVKQEWESPYAFPMDNPVMLADPTGCSGEDKGKVNVSFYPASSVKGKENSDACGADGDGNGTDDCLDGMRASNEAASATPGGLKSFGITNRSEITAHLQELRKEGYQIGNIILNAHCSAGGNFYLEGPVNINEPAIQDELINMLKGNVSSSSVLILHACNVGAGNNPTRNGNSIQRISTSLNIPILASMSFGTGSSDAFNTKGVEAMYSSRLPNAAYEPGGIRETYSDASILYAQCYLGVMPQPIFGRQRAIVSSLTFKPDGSFTFKNAAPMLRKNAGILQDMMSRGRRSIPASSPIPGKK